MGSCEGNISASRVFDNVPWVTMDTILKEHNRNAKWHLTGNTRSNRTWPTMKLINKWGREWQHGSARAYTVIGVAKRRLKTSVQVLSATVSVSSRNGIVPRFSQWKLTMRHTRLRQSRHSFQNSLLRDRPVTVARGLTSLAPIPKCVFEVVTLTVTVYPWHGDSSCN